MTKKPHPPSPASLSSLKHLASIYLFIFVVWGFYRLLFRFPEEIEETILKPLIWLSPLIYILFKEKASLTSIGWTTKNLFKSLYWGIGFGFVFALEGLALNYLKYNNFNFLDLGLVPSAFFLAITLSLITAITEETVFRGFFFNRLWQAGHHELGANLATSFAWTLIHLPIALFVFKYPPGQLFLVLFLIFLFGVGSSIVFARTKNIASSILLHLLWAWPIILFR